METLNTIAAALDDLTAPIFLDRPDPVEKRGPISVFDYDVKLFEFSLNSDRPAMWLDESTYMYVLEAAHEIRALSILIRERHVAGAIEPLIRCVIERVGKVRWLLDPGVQSEKEQGEEDDVLNARRRAVRCSIEYLICLTHQRRYVEGIGQKGAGEFRKQLRSDRELIGSWFKIERPLEPDGAENSDPASWTFSGETYPTFEGFTKWAFAGRVEITGRDRQRLNGLYGSLSAWSHPNFLAARVHSKLDDSHYWHSSEQLVGLLDLAVRAFVPAVMLRLEYRDHFRDTIGRELDEALVIWNEVKILDR